MRQRLATLLLLLSPLTPAQLLPVSPGPVIDAGAPGETACGAAAIWKPGVAGYEPMGDAPFDTLRYGLSGAPFSCSVSGIPNGFYRVDVQMIEPNKTAKNQRLFTVTVNGIVSPSIDLFLLTGGQKRPYTYTTFLTLNNNAGMNTNTVRLDLKATLGNAVLAGFAVWPLALSDLAPGKTEGGSVNIAGKWVDLFDETHAVWMQTIQPSASRDIPYHAVKGDTPWRVVITNSQGRLDDAQIDNGAFLSGILAPNGVVVPGLPISVTRNGLRLAASQYTVEWPDMREPPVRVTVPGAQPGDVILVDYYTYGIHHN